MDFSSSLDYLYGLQRFGLKLGLENMRALLQRLPSLRETPCVHVAGTNGKGSVSVCLAEILKQSGLRVGLYTSPHLHCFTERIRIDGVEIGREEMVSLAETVRLAAGDLPVTFFEATTAMALLAFRQHGVDIAVVETGLGGRLDATNIVEPQLCLITPISQDHSEHLGDSLTAIATEKAGIVKPGVPVVIGRQLQEVYDVLLETAAGRGAEVLLAGRDYSWRGGHENLRVDTGDWTIGGLSCALAGTHQLDNFAQAVAGAWQLRAQGLPVTEKAVQRAGKTVFWPGRLEWWGESRLLLLDAAHNHAGACSLAEYLAGQGVPRIRLVTGLSGERDPWDVLKPLVNLTAAVYAVPVPFGQSVSTDKVAEWAESQGLPATRFATAGEGLVTALDNVTFSEPVVVCGSIYLVAELRHMLLEGELSVTQGVADFSGML